MDLHMQNLCQINVVISLATAVTSPYQLPSCQQIAFLPTSLANIDKFYEKLAGPHTEECPNEL